MKSKPKVLVITKDSLKAAKQAWKDFMKEPGLDLFNCIDAFADALCVPPPEDGWVEGKEVGYIKYFKGKYGLSRDPHFPYNWTLFDTSNDTQVVTLKLTYISPQKAQAWADGIIAEREAGEKKQIAPRKLRFYCRDCGDETGQCLCDAPTIVQHIAEPTPAPIAPGTRYRLNTTELRIIGNEENDCLAAVNQETFKIVKWGGECLGRWYMSETDLHAALIAAGAERVE